MSTDDELFMELAGEALVTGSGLPQPFLRWLDLLDQYVDQLDAAPERLRTAGENLRDQVAAAALLSATPSDVGTGAWWGTTAGTYDDRSRDLALRGADLLAQTEEVAAEVAHVAEVIDQARHAVTTIRTRYVAAAWTEVARLYAAGSDVVRLLADLSATARRLGEPAVAAAYRELAEVQSALVALGASLPARASRVFNPDRLLITLGIGTIKTGTEQYLKDLPLDVSLIKGLQRSPTRLWTDVLTYGLVPPPADVFGHPAGWDQRIPSALGAGLLASGANSLAGWTAGQLPLTRMRNLHFWETHNAWGLDVPRNWGRPSTPKLASSLTPGAMFAVPLILHGADALSTFTVGLPSPTDPNNHTYWRDVLVPSALSAVGVGVLSGIDKKSPAMGLVAAGAVGAQQVVSRLAFDPPPPHPEDPVYQIAHQPIALVADTATSANSLRVDERPGDGPAVHVTRGVINLGEAGLVAGLDAIGRSIDPVRPASNIVAGITGGPQDTAMVSPTAAEVAGVAWQRALDNGYDALHDAPNGPVDRLVSATANGLAVVGHSLLALGPEVFSPVAPDLREEAVQRWRQADDAARRFQRAVRGG